MLRRLSAPERAHPFLAAATFIIVPVTWIPRAEEVWSNWVVFFFFCLAEVILGLQGRKKGEQIRGCKTSKKQHSGQRKKKDEPAVRIMKNTRTVEGTELQAYVKRICKELLI